MTTWLRKDKEIPINKKRIEQLYRLMGLQTIGPKPNTSKPGKHPKVYSYLLGGLSIAQAKQVWAMDITYSPIQGGFLYLCALIDLYSRYVVGWPLSNTIDAQRCRSTLQEAAEKHRVPDILNTGQGSQFTSDVFT